MDTGVPRPMLVAQQPLPERLLGMSWDWFPVLASGWPCSSWERLKRAKESGCGMSPINSIKQQLPCGKKTMWPCKIGRSLDDKLGIVHCRVWLLQGNYARNPQNFAMCHNSIPSGPSRNGKPQLFPTTQGYPTQRFNFQEQRGTIRWRNAHFDYPKTKRGSPVKCSISHSARPGLKQDIHTMFVHLYRTWPPQ